MSCPETVGISWYIVVCGSCDYRSMGVFSKPSGKSICVMVNIEDFFELQVEDREWISLYILIATHGNATAISSIATCSVRLLWIVRLFRLQFHGRVSGIAHSPASTSRRHITIHLFFRKKSWSK